METGNLINGHYYLEGDNTFQSVNPKTKETIQTAFTCATQNEVNLAVLHAQEAFLRYRNISGKTKAQFLRNIAQNIEDLGESLIEKASEESGLPKARITGERGRTCAQLRLFASLLENGSWVRASIDHGDLSQSPPKPDIRLMSRPVGPVVVFTASNFPLAFSTAGGDTASALASGCPVIVKAHPSHPGTNALVSRAINEAMINTDIPVGTYATLYDDGHEVGAALVQHPGIKSVAFTGSYKGGMAIHKLAQDREEPIPVFSEMGSINPVFILENKLQKDHEQLANTLANSCNMGAGQFCTNPGIQVIDKNNASSYISALEKEFSNLKSFTMLNEGIYKNYQHKKSQSLENDLVETLHNTENTGDWNGSPAVAAVSSTDFVANPSLQEEVFGPFSLVVLCDEKTSMQDVARSFSGQLTCTIMCTEKDHSKASEIFQIMEDRVGRIIFNGAPTGVAVNHAMHHGGPFPAATDSRFTSVGADAIYRFVKPVCYQDCPDLLLPAELQENNPLKIDRKINGKMMTS